jgi:RNA polymerase subunit RPABC4/transcription elongation factor Spt4
MADKVKCSNGHENEEGWRVCKQCGESRCGKGHMNKKGSRFCGACGEKLAGGEAVCWNCGQLLDSGASFCGNCGKSTVSPAPALEGQMDGFIWRREPDAFAKRIEISDLKGLFHKGFIVEQGTKAMLFMNGAFVETLQPGKYDLAGGFMDKLINLCHKLGIGLVNTATALLIDAGDVELNVDLSGVYTKDPVSIDITSKIISQIEEPVLFLNNVMKSRTGYLISELRNTLYTEMHNAFSEVVGAKSIEELNWDLSLKRQFEVAVENHLRTTFQRNGLNFVQLRTIDYRFKGYDKIRGIHEETYLLVSEDEAKLQKRKRFFDVYDKTQIQEIIEGQKEVEYREKRQKTLADMRALVNSDKMNEVKSADDLEAYLHEINKGKYLREDEVLELKNVFQQSGLKREALLRKIELEQDLERERIKLVGREENELARFEAEAKWRREKLNLQKDTKSAEREIRVDDAKADKDIQDLKRDSDREDMMMGLDGLERIKKVKTQEKRDEMEIEAERLERMSSLGIEVLMTLKETSPEKAQLLKELKETEILKGMSEEQILAMGAGRSDELARAFQEKYRGLSADRQEQLYQQMMAQKDKSMQTMQQMFDKALETQRDATVGVAQGGRVIYPPSGPGFGYGGPYGPGGDAGAAAVAQTTIVSDSSNREVKVVVCTRCHSDVPTGQRFCPNCGNEMY